jgi:L-fucose isomerase-like protein
MAKKPPIRVGVFSGYDPRPWVMKECADGDIAILQRFIAALSRAGNYEVVYPGKKLAGHDRLCYTMDLADAYAREFADRNVDVLINVHQTWTFPQISQKVITSFIHKMSAKNPRFVPRIVLASIQDTRVPGMVSGMATGGALAQIGLAYAHIYGDFDSPEFMARLGQELAFFGGMADAHPKISDVVDNLHREHILEFGSFSLRMPTTRIDQEEVMARWGITFENLDQQVFLDRAFEMLEWGGREGCSPVKAIHDKRVSAVMTGIYDRHPEKFTAVAGRSVPRDTFALQVACYFAVADIAKEKGAGAVTIKCQDECSSRYATCCIATSFLGNDRDPAGNVKEILPASCETDLPTLLSQLFLYRISGKPAGFGDFRYVKTDGDTTVLAVVNCGQHPVYYADREGEDFATKLAHTEFPGQEHFYAAGGAAVRMRSAGGQEVTLARLGVENGRLYLAATVMDTYDVDVSRHTAYNEAWPIIEGYVPVTDRVLARQWPSNHLGFVYGNYLPHLTELAEELGIGYTIWDRDGRLSYKPS